MHNTRRLVLATLGALLLAPAGVFAAEPPPTTPAVQAPVLAPRDKVTLQRLHDANQTAMQMGKEAQDKGSSRAVRDFGRRFSDDHQVADRKIDEYLRTRGADITALATTTSADPDHELLSTKLGLDFNRAFVQQTVQDLQQTLDLLSSERIATADDNLRLVYDDLTATFEADKRAAEALLAGMTRT